MMNRYKSVGWRNESYRHSLASKGVKTKKVDLKKYQGTYKQVSIKNEPWFQKGCKDVEATYKLRSDGRMDVINKCDGREMKGVARSVSEDNRRLKVKFGSFPEGDYKIDKIDDDYDDVTVKSGKTIWQLKRKGRMSAKKERVFDDYEQLEMDVMEGKIDDTEYVRRLVELRGKERKQRMAYVPTYTGADLAPIAADGVGTAGAVAVGWIPLLVAAGVIYGGAKYAKGQSDKYKKQKKKKVKE